MNLSIREAEYFLAIISEGNMTKAARQLYIAQPSLTLTVQKLEQQLGTKLFIREGNRMSPTYAGKRFEEACNKLVKICRDMENEFEDMNQLTSGKVIIGMPFNLICYVFPPLYSICRKQFPEIQVIPKEGVTKELETLLLNDMLDLIVVPLTLSNLSSVNAQTILQEQLILSVPEGHWMNEHAIKKEGSKRLYMDLKLADRQPFVMSLPGQRTRQATELIMREAGITPKVVFITRNVGTKIAMSATGLGLAIFPEHYLALGNHPKGANYYYMDGDYSVKWEIAVAYRKDTYFSNACAKCIEILTTLFKEGYTSDYADYQM